MSPVPWVRLTVRQRVLVAAAITILLSGLAGYQVYRESQRSAVLVASYTSTLSAASTGRTLAVVATNIDRLLRETVRTQDDPALAGDPARCRSRLEELARLGPLGGVVSNLYVVEGSTVRCQLLEGPISVTDAAGNLFRELQPAANPRELRASQPFVGSLSKRWIISVALPRETAAAVTAGVAIDLARLNEYALAGSPSQLLITVTDTDGVTVLRSFDFEAKVGQAVPFLPEVVDIQQQVQGRPFEVSSDGLPRVVQENAVVSPDRDGSQRVWSAQAVEGVPWILYAGVSTAIVTAPWTVVGLGPATSILLVVAVLLLLATVTRSLGRLIDGLALSATQGPGVIPVDGPADVAMLGRALQTTLAARIKSEADLEAVNRGLERTVDERSRELRTKAADLEQVVAKLVEADRVKDTFLSTMSHELRTPITSILALSEALLAETYGPLNSEQRHALKICVQCANDQTELIREVLDYTKLRSGSVVYELAPTPLGELIDGAAGAVRAQAAKKHQTVATQVADPAAMVTVDARRVRQVLLILLDNAIKFSPEGKPITVTAAVTEAELRIAVVDHGVGIPADRRDSVFDAFVQVDAGLRRSFEGLGLGLAICRSIVTQHGGTIEVSSEVGVGSRFVVTMPRHGGRPPMA